MAGFVRDSGVVKEKRAQSAMQNPTSYIQITLAAADKKVGREGDLQEPGSVRVSPVSEVVRLTHDRSDMVKQRASTVV